MHLHMYYTSVHDCFEWVSESRCQFTRVWQTSFNKNHQTSVEVDPSHPIILPHPKALKQHRRMNWTSCRCRSQGQQNCGGLGARKNQCMATKTACGGNNLCRGEVGCSSSSSTSWRAGRSCLIACLWGSICRCCFCLFLSGKIFHMFEILSFEAVCGALSSSSQVLVFSFVVDPRLPRKRRRNPKRMLLQLLLALQMRQMRPQQPQKKKPGRRKKGRGIPYYSKAFSSKQSEVLIIRFV